MNNLLRKLWPIVGLPLVATALFLGCAPSDPGDPSSGEAQVGKKDKKEGIKAQEIPAGLKQRIEAALEHVRQRELLTTHSFWTVFHGILGNGLTTTLKNPQTDKEINAIDYIFSGGELRGLQFIPEKTGLDVRLGPVFDGQGHQDQFVAEMVQQGMTQNKPVTVNGKKYTFDDFVQHSKARARVTANQELSWTIVILSQFYGTNFRWTNSQGENLHFEDLIRYETNQPVDSAACGGTHRLFGLTWALNIHRQKNSGPLAPVWQQALTKLDSYVTAAKKFQNADGSFSTEYLKERANSPDPDRRINTTGHVLEWLALHLSDEELLAPWVQDAANAVSLMLLESRGVTLDGGSLYHAAHGLHLYHSRVFGNLRGQNQTVIPLPPIQKAEKI